MSACTAECLSCHENLKHRAFQMVNLVVINHAVLDRAMALDKCHCLLFEVVLLHEGNCRPDTWNQEYQYQKGCDSLGLYSKAFISVLSLLEFKIAYKEVSREGDEKTVDAEEVQGTEEGYPVAGSKAITRSTKRWHKGCSDCHT